MAIVTPLKSVSSVRDMMLHERLIEMLHYEPETGDFFWKKSPTGSVKAGNKAGTSCKGKLDTTYFRLKLDGKFYYLHNLAWFYVNKTWPSALIDHVNGNSNAINNLREASHAQNSAYRRVTPNKKHGFKGVASSRYQFVARIWLNGRNKILGYFATAQEAALAYDQAALELFGEFALTNKKLGLI